MLKGLLFAAPLVVAIFAGLAVSTNAETKKIGMMTDWMPCVV